MAVDAREFRRWAESVGLPSAVATLARTLDVSRATLQAQFVRGRVAEQTVVTAARAAGTGPVAALSAFSDFAGLADRVTPPTVAELLSQTTYIDVSMEVVARIAGPLGEVGDRYPEPPLPTLDGVRSWFNAVDDGELRRRVSEAAGIVPQGLSTSLTDNKLRPQLAVLAADLAGVSAASGLVVTGLVTPEEGGWPAHARRGALAGLGELELIEHMTERSRHAARIVGRAVEEQARVQKFRDTLG